MQPYSVLMPVYYKDNPEWLKISIDSMLNQTISPDEFVIVKDGALTDQLNNVIEIYVSAYSGLFKIVNLEKNCGLGIALKLGIENCTNEFIARMDADDYSMPNRIEKQFEVFEKNPELDVVGSNVEEFIDSIDNVISHVVLPEKHEDIYIFAKKRCPIRHPTLLYKKSAVVKAGNYRHCLYCEDYDLIVKLLLAGVKIYNIQNPLVKMRTSADFYKRRGGFKYLRCIYKAKRSFLKSGFFSLSDFIVSFSGHAIVILMPGVVRKFVYNKFLRG